MVTGHRIIWLIHITEMSVYLGQPDSPLHTATARQNRNQGCLRGFGCPEEHYLECISTLKMAVHSWQTKFVRVVGSQERLMTVQ